MESQLRLGLAVTARTLSAQGTMEMNFIRRHEADLKAAVPDARELEWPGASHYLAARALITAGCDPE